MVRKQANKSHGFSGPSVFGISEWIQANIFQSSIWYRADDIFKKYYLVAIASCLDLYRCTSEFSVYFFHVKIFLSGNPSKDV